MVEPEQMSVPATTSSNERVVARKLVAKHKILVTQNNKGQLTVRHGDIFMHSKQ
jgi:hypothetical protein